MSSVKDFEYVDAKQPLFQKVVQVMKTSVKYTLVMASLSLNVFLFIGAIELEKQNAILQTQLEYTQNEVARLDQQLKAAIVPEATIAEFIENKLNKIFPDQQVVETKIEQKQEIIAQKEEVTLEKIKKSFADLWNLSVN